MRITFSAIFVALLVAGCSSNSPYSFDVTIPDSVQSLEEALEYVRQAENDRGFYLFETDEARVTGGVGSIPELVPPDFLVLIWGDDEAQAERIKEELGTEFRRVFDRWDVCKIDIAWELYADSDEIEEYPEGRPRRYSGDINPGCDEPAVKDRRKPGAEDFFR